MHRRHFLHLLGAATGSLLLGCGTDGSTEPEDTGPWWLRGNYGPVPDEIEAFDLAVEGAIPPEINGVFLRNGANPVSGHSDHWFLGDGMVHGIRIQDGKALWYRNRYIDTLAYRAGGSDNLGANRANTSLIYHHDHLLALYEGGVPHHMDPETLATHGEYDFAGELVRPMSAHPKIDPVTGEMWFIGYAPFPPYLTLHVVDAAGALIRSDAIDIPRSTMMHDFQLTASHVVIMDLPILFDLAAAETTGFPFRWDASAGARIGVLPRSAPASEIVWIDIDLCYVFHTFNAFEDTDGNVILEGCRLPSLWSDDVGDASEPPTPWRWTLNTTTRTATESQLYELSTDFPRIDPRMQGIEHRIGYGLHFEPGDAFNAATPVGIVKHDRSQGSTELWTTPHQPDEAIFVPSAEGEDAGYVMSVLYDRERQGSQAVILDASRLSDGPIARIALPRRVPFGFHGEFVTLA